MDTSHGQDKVAVLEAEVAALQAKVQKLERGLNVEVWDHKRAKFVPFREMPDVKKVLENDT